jgi:hypothetical protein
VKRQPLVIALVLVSSIFLVVALGPTNPLLLLLKPNLVVVELERQGCYGICPIYSLRILGDGQVSYAGQHFMLEDGVQATHITPGQVLELVAAFEKIGFSTMPDHLLYGIEDLEESRTCLTVANTRKCVEIRWTYPAGGVTELAKLKELNTLIDEVTHVEQWVGTREQIIEQRR